MGASAGAGNGGACWSEASKEGRSEVWDTGRIGIVERGGCGLESRLWQSMWLVILYARLF